MYVVFDSIVNPDTVLNIMRSYIASPYGLCIVSRQAVQLYTYDTINENLGHLSEAEQKEYFLELASKTIPETNMVITLITASGEPN